MSEAETDYSLKKMKRSKDSYRPKTLMERQPIVVNTSKTIPVPKKKKGKKVTILEPENKVAQQEQHQESDCNCDGKCHCEDYDEVVKRKGKKFY